MLCLEERNAIKSYMSAFMVAHIGKVQSHTPNAMPTASNQGLSDSPSAGRLETLSPLCVYLGLAILGYLYKAISTSTCHKVASLIPIPHSIAWKLPVSFPYPIPLREDIGKCMS